MSSRVKRNWEFFASILIIILTFFVMFAYYNRWFSFAARVGPYRIIHYIAFAGTFYIAFGVIFFSLIKRRSFSHPKTLLGVHTFGNLFSFLLVSMHFAGQVGRPADFYPEFGTGLALYISMVLLVSTGLSLRFGILKSKPKTKRFIHVSLAFTFYIIIFVHILHGIGIIQRAPNIASYEISAESQEYVSIPEFPFSIFFFPTLIVLAVSLVIYKKKLDLKQF